MIYESVGEAEVHKAVIMELQRIQRITNDQILYNAGFARTITGESAISDSTILVKIAGESYNRRHK